MFSAEAEKRRYVSARMCAPCRAPLGTLLANSNCHAAPDWSRRRAGHLAYGAVHRWLPFSGHSMHSGSNKHGIALLSCPLVRNHFVHHLRTSPGSLWHMKKPWPGVHSTLICQASNFATVYNSGPVCPNDAYRRMSDYFCLGRLLHRGNEPNTSESQT